MLLLLCVFQFECVGSTRDAVGSTKVAVVASVSHKKCVSFIQHQMRTKEAVVVLVVGGMGEAAGAAAARMTAGRCALMTFLKGEQLADLF